MRKIAISFIVVLCLCAVRSVSGYTVRPGHPRILITPDNIALLRERAGTVQRDVYENLTNFCDSHMDETKSTWMTSWDRRTLRYALLYQLGEISGFTYDDTDNDGDEVYSVNDYGRKAVDIMMLLVNYSLYGIGDSGDAYYSGDEDSIAIAYDWVYDLLTEPQKQEIVNY